jgi:hypothetical protein
MGATARAMMGSSDVAPAPEQTRGMGARRTSIASDGEETDSSSIDVSLDPRHRRITFRVTYSSAMITAFALIVAVAVAYVIGRRVARGPAVAVASETTEQIRSRPPRPDVLNVPPANTSSNNSQNAGTTAPPREPDHGVSSRTNTGSSEGAGSSPTTAASPQGRVVGMNYLVIQSYPDEKSALEARDMLLKVGIGCTVERQKFRGLNPDWYTVVGTQGFVRASGTEYEAYKNRLSELSQQFAQTKRSFKAFALLPYKWDKPGP